MAVFYLYIFLCVAATVLMWFMQIVHYPLMSYTDPAKWEAFSEKRRMLTMMITYPLMAFEVLTGFTLLVIATQSKTYPLFATSLLILVCLIIYTFMYLNPHLKKMTGPNDSQNHQRFLKLHWVRTIGWTVRFLLMLLILLGSS